MIALIDILCVCIVQMLSNSLLEHYTLLLLSILRCAIIYVSFTLLGWTSSLPLWTLNIASVASWIYQGRYGDMKSYERVCISPSIFDPIGDVACHWYLPRICLQCVFCIDAAKMEKVASKS